jgi:hypothetical protein
VQPLAWVRIARLLTTVAVSAVLLATLARCSPAQVAPSSIEASAIAASIEPGDLLSQAFAASIATTSFHVDATGQSIIRPVDSSPDDLTGGETHLIGDIDTAVGYGDFVLTTDALPGRSLHIRSIRQGESDPSAPLGTPPRVLLESATTPGQWLDNPGLRFGDGLGSYTARTPTDPSRFFRQISALVARIGARGSIVSLADASCASGECAVVELDATTWAANGVCQSGQASRCPVSFVLNFSIDQQNHWIAGLTSRFQVRGMSGVGIYAFSGWNQHVSIDIPPPEDIQTGDGTLR